MDFGIIGSLGLILLSGFLIGYLLNKIKIPGLVGMILIGFLFGPYVLNIISPSLLNISSELRQIALIIILTRSGLNLDFNRLKKVGISAVLMCFIPATFEIVGVAFASHFLLDLSYIEGFMLGAVLAAVSPAVVSPRMINLIENKVGSEHSLPELILAGSSADDIYAIVIFYAFLGFAKTNNFDVLSVCMVPISIILGIGLGLGVGFFLSFIFKKIKMPLIAKIIILLSSTFLMVLLENVLKNIVSISSLLGVVVVGMIILFRNKEEGTEISKGYNKLWKVFEILLFVLVGASVDFTVVVNNGINAIFVLLIGLTLRSIGVLVSTCMLKISWKERIFCIISYLPKATVQASIGGIALSSGLACGNLVLAVSVLSILVTAPLGALLIDLLSKKLLKNDNKKVLN